MKKPSTSASFLVSALPKFHLSAICVSSPGWWDRLEGSLLWEEITLSAPVPYLLFVHFCLQYLNTSYLFFLVRCLSYGIPKQKVNMAAKQVQIHIKYTVCDLLDVLAANKRYDPHPQGSKLLKQR